MTSRIPPDGRPDVFNTSPRRPVLRFVSRLAFTLVLPACVDNTFRIQGQAPSQSPAPSTYPYQYLPEAPVLDLAGLRDFVGRFRHHVVLVDVWAAWSRRCREELRELAHLRTELEQEGFYVISFNLDAPSRWRDQTVPILHAASSNFPCVVVAAEAQADMRLWLAPNWDLSLPARFLVDRRGEIIAQMFDDTPISVVAQRCRDAARSGSAEGPRPQNGIALRAKVIDVSAGRGVTLPEITTSTVNPMLLAERLTPLIDQRLRQADGRAGDRTARGPRVAILPFAPVEDRARPTAVGERIARLSAEALRREGRADVLMPAEAERLIQRAGQTRMSIDYEPGLIKGLDGCDFVVVGWLRGPMPENHPLPEPVETARRPARPDDRSPIAAGGPLADDAP